MTGWNASAPARRSSEGQRGRCQHSRAPEPARVHQPRTHRHGRRLPRPAAAVKRLNGHPRLGGRSPDWVRRLGVSPIRPAAADRTVIAVGADRYGGPADNLGHVGSRRVAVDRIMGGDRPQPAIDRRLGAVTTGASVRQSRRGSRCASWVRDVMPRFPNALPRWYPTVLGLIQLRLSKVGAATEHKHPLKHWSSP
jgi:hypothetical protein